MKIANKFLAAATFVMTMGCSDFETLNTDPSKSSETQPEFLLGNAQKRASDLIYHNYYNGRIGMELAQYWMGTDKTSEGRFLFTDEGFWSGLYAGPLMDLQEIRNYYQRHPQEISDNMIAVSEIMKSWLFHILTDTYGDVPYSQALQGDEIPQPVFDEGKAIYTSLLENLKSQISVLSNPNSGAIRGDIVAEGNPQKWIRIANALRIRIALRMSDVMANEAKAVIEEAAANTLTGVEDDIFFPYNLAAATNRFPYNDVDRPLVEFAVTATLVEYLKESNDPRLSVYARPDETNGAYVGKVFGTEANSPIMTALSKPGVKAYAGDAKGYIITYAEVALALAEAAQRGMNVGGTAEDWYKKGVTASLKQWGVTDEAVISDYLAQNPYQAEDWVNIVGTQKWLALYLQGLQGWFERLRLDNKKTGGAVLFIPPASGSLDPEVSDVPKRLKYPASTRANNAENSRIAAERIGGDSQATRNWWDIK